MAFRYPQKVLFKHCDPAGLVFYPRYFEMINDCVEAFFEAELDRPFESFHGTGAVPTVQIDTRFPAPSRHGDALVLTLAIEALGRTSMTYRVSAHASNDLRFEARATIVNTGADGQPVPWDAEIRSRIEAHKETAS